MNAYKKKSKTQEWLNASGNEGVKAFVAGGEANGGTIAPIPEDASREEQDIMRVYQGAYNNAQGINRRADNAVFSANKAHDLAMKYLAAQNKAQGLDGLGVADTSKIRLSSQYQQALSDAYGTRESALQENQKAMNDDVNTIRSEWASQEEAKRQQKFTAAETYIQNMEDESTVDKYLNSIGFEDGTEEYQELLSTWANVHKVAFDKANDEKNYEEILMDTDAYSVKNRLIQKGYANDDGTLNEQGQKMYDDWKYANGITDEEEKKSFALHDQSKAEDVPLDQWSEKVYVTKALVSKFVDSDDMIGKNYKIESNNFISQEDFIKRAGKSGKGGLNSGEAGWFGGERARSKAIATAVSNGTLVDGTIVDTNIDDGQKLWLYKNGKFYRLKEVK
ncbi:MAG: hypothetical protein IIX01_01435 [Clostridia bacterium]|nr:hypothetical protein [Clostridia bacterium]